MIIEPSALAARIGLRELRIVDVRWYLTDPDRGRTEYRTGHLPGAVFCDLETDLTGSEGPGRHPLPRVEEFSATLRRLGLDRSDHVVAYDDSGGAIAARLWWMLRSIGHPDVSVLDGGFTAWVAEGHPVTKSEPRIKPGSYPTAVQWSGVVDRKEVERSNGPLIDAREPDRYLGVSEPIDPQAGHIPGAANLPYPGNLGPDGRFLPVRKLKERYAGIGPDPIVYCGSGVTACHDLLAMSLAGRNDGLLYEGSWSDWSRLTSAPVAIGTEA
jgi:thiosulfate/3-mercaptopyruvate sulfurtransferase